MDILETLATNQWRVNSFLAKVKNDKRHSFYRPPQDQWKPWWEFPYDYVKRERIWKPKFQCQNCRLEVVEITEMWGCK